MAWLNELFARRRNRQLQARLNAFRALPASMRPALSGYGECPWSANLAEAREIARSER